MEKFINKMQFAQKSQNFMIQYILDKYIKKFKALLSAFFMPRKRCYMFRIYANNNICLTRGDIANLSITAKNIDGTDYIFKVDDVVRLNIFKKGDCTVVLKKEITIQEETTNVNISLTSEETKIGDLINKPTEYWYEIVLNPDTYPQTIVGYMDSPTVFKLLPEANDGGVA